MYAIIGTGGKQFRVREGQICQFERLSGEPGSKVTFNEVLMVADGDSVKLGKPYVSGAKVEASVVAEGRHKKIHVLKFKRRKNYLRQMGHRQYYTEVKIDKIIGGK